MTAFNYLKENSRIVLMFCAFEGAPKIVRLHGRGEVIEPSHDEFQQLRTRFPEYVGLRSFIRIHCHRISDSCGWSVPIYEYRNQRSQLVAWAENKGVSGVAPSIVAITTIGALRSTQRSATLSNRGANDLITQFAGM